MSADDNDRAPAGKGPRQGLRRFYETAAVGPATAAGFPVELDGRAVRTPGKRPLVLPTSTLAAAIAVEWQDQGERLDPGSMPLTRLANTALDGIVGQEAAVAADIVAFAGCDLVCYRADHPADLASLQAEAWDPVLAWAASDLDARFVVTRGIIHVDQPADALARVATALVGRTALELCGLHIMTTLTGSALVALAHAHGRLTLESAWAAAHVDEDYQISLWGADEEASARRAFRQREMAAASRLLRLQSG
ncbi:MAG: ATP12 family protein [Hyphomicrobiaceae bacterium]|nr:ATP12 family protein [Hyphomicrobiaceae bacterium]